jgi:hypothetical protein
MTHLNDLWPWITLAALGAFHGLNPAMGWLFAVALGLQERRLAAVVGALGPIALGHALAIGLVAVPIGLLQLAIPRPALLIATGVALMTFAAYKVLTRFRHPRWIGMRVGSRQLVVWSFVMATAHGAGLMLAPVLANLRGAGVATAQAADHPGHAHHLHLQTAAADDSAVSGLAPALAAVSWHTVAMLLVMGTLAVVVYSRLGVEVLRRAWINLDLIWAGALVITGGATLLAGLWSGLAG